MLELNQLSGIPKAQGADPGSAFPAVPQLGRRISFAIEIPFQRADLPALSLIGLALALIGWGIWMEGNLRLLSDATSATRIETPLLTALFQTGGVPLTFALALAILILAAALALSPLRWWAYVRFVYKRGITAQWRRQRMQDPEDAEAWVAAQAAWIAEYQAAANQLESQSPKVGSAAGMESTEEAQRLPGDGQPVNQSAEATATTAAEPAPATTDHSTAAQSASGAQATEPNAVSPAAEGEAGAQQSPEDAQQPQAQSPATQQDAAQAPAQQAATQAENTGESSATKAAHPKPAATPQQPSSDLAALAEEAKDAALDLEELTDVEDILSSFADNDTISAHLLTLSASVNEVDLAALVTHIQAVAKQFQAGQLIK